MKNKEILIKAISKAISNGCKYPTFDIDENIWVDHNLYYGVIFAHDFAKAFWGEEYDYFPLHDDPCAHQIAIHQESWEYHLQKMVLEPDPLKYLEKYL